MALTKGYRIVVALNLLIIFVQFGFAGQMLAGNDSAVAIHGVLGVTLILIALLQSTLSIALRAKGIAPFWIIASNIGVLVAEIIEAACGHFHNLTIHVPLAVAIFGGVMRQLFWSMRETAATELRA